MKELRILAIDDEPDILMILERLIRDAGYVVICANSGERVLELALEQHPILIILDYNMPGMNGLQVAKILKTNPQTTHIPIVLITAYTTPELEMRVISIGAGIDYLPKPFPFDSLNNIMWNATCKLRSHLPSSLPDNQLSDSLPFPTHEELVDLLHRSNISVISLHISAQIEAIKQLLALRAVFVEPMSYLWRLSFTDFLVVLPSYQAEEALEELLQHFYDTAQHIQTSAVLTFGLAQGPFQSLDTLMIEVGRDHKERHQSQLGKSNYTPAVSQLAESHALLAESHALYERYQQASQLRELYTRQLQQRDKRSNYKIHAKIDQLIAIVNHDLTNGLIGLNESIEEIIDSTDPNNQYIEETRLWMEAQLVLCRAWLRSMTELGSGSPKHLKERPLGPWLEHHLPLLGQHLGFELKIHIFNHSQSAIIPFDEALLQVALLNLLLIAQLAGADTVWVSLAIADGTLTLHIWDNGKVGKRYTTLIAPSALMISVKRLPLILVRHVLQDQGITLLGEQKHKQFMLQLGFPISQPAPTSLHNLSVSELHRAIEQTDQTVALLESMLYTQPERAIVPLFLVNRILMFYLTRLEHDLRKLVERAASLSSMTEAHAKHTTVHSLALYCYLLARNLMLALKGEVLPIEIVNPNVEIQEVLILLQHKIDQEILSIQLDLFSELPSVAIAGVELKQVLMNLIRNALEAMKNKGVLKITTLRDADDIVIEIQDSGCGIRPEYRTKIYQLNFSTKGRGTDSGVGMYAVQSIVKRAGGRLKVASVSVDSTGRLQAWQTNFSPNEILIPPKSGGTRSFDTSASRQRLVLNQPGTVFQIVLPIARDI